MVRHKLLIKMQTYLTPFFIPIRISVRTMMFDKVASPERRVHVVARSMIKYAINSVDLLELKSFVFFFM